MVYERWREWSMMYLCLLSIGEPEIEKKHTLSNKSWLKESRQSEFQGHFYKDYWIYTDI